MAVTSLSACGMKVNAQPGTKSSELDVYQYGEQLYFGSTGKLCTDYSIDQDGNITSEGKILILQENVEPLTYVTEVKRIGNETYVLRGDVLEDGTIATEPKDFELKLETNAEDVVCRRFILESDDFMAMYFPYEKNTKAGVMVPPIDNDRPVDDIIPFATFQAHENGFANIVIHGAFEGTRTITIKDIFYNVIGEFELKFDADTSKKADEKNPADNATSETEKSQAEEPEGQNTSARGNGVQTNRIPTSGTQTSGTQTSGTQTSGSQTSGSQTTGNQNTGNPNNENQQPVSSANTNQITQPAPHQHTFESKSVAACGDSYMDTYTDPLPHEHSYNQRTVDATCEQGGYTEFTCTICGYSYRGNEIGALGHNYSSTVIEPQVGIGGYTHHVCSRCGASYDDSYTNALPQPAQYSAVEAANYGNAFLTAMGIPLRSYEFTACRQMVTNYDPSFFGYTQDGLNDLMEQLVINNIAAAYSEPGITIGTDPGQLETVVAYCFGTDNPDGTIDLSCWYGYDGYHSADGQTLWH